MYILVCCCSALLHSITCNECDLSNVLVQATFHLMTKGYICTCISEYSSKGICTQRAILRACRKNPTTQKVQCIGFYLNHWTSASSQGRHYIQLLMLPMLLLPMHVVKLFRLVGLNTGCLLWLCDTIDDILKSMAGRIVSHSISVFQIFRSKRQTANKHPVISCGFCFCFCYMKYFYFDLKVNHTYIHTYLPLSLPCGSRFVHIHLQLQQTMRYHWPCLSFLIFSAF